MMLVGVEKVRKIHNNELKYGVVNVMLCFGGTNDYDRQRCG